jgi:hypothetical protein
MHIVRLNISVFREVRAPCVALGRHAEKVAGGCLEQSTVGSEDLRTNEDQTIARGYKHCGTIGVDCGGMTSLAEDMTTATHTFDGSKRILERATYFLRDAVENLPII